VRLFYPEGANPKPFPALLPTNSVNFGSFNLRLDNAIMLATGALVIACLELLLNRTKLGLAIRAVAQDEETARTMGVNFTAVVLIAFAIGSALAAFAGIMDGFYYNEINFGMGLYLGPAVSPATLAEAEKFVRVEMTAAERAQGAGNWRSAMAPL
jgi:branched-chain amino acid transport system permease protein